MMIRKRSLQRGTIVVAVAASLLIAACTSPTTSSTQNGKQVLTVAYSSEYVFLTPQLATQWWHAVGSQFEKKYPNVTVRYEPIPGNYNDFNSKLALLYRTPGTSPDVAELPSALMGEWVSSGDLLALNKYVANSSWWSKYPESVKVETTVNGKVYAINHGENTEALYYNVPMFKKAGIPVPWQPHTWQDIYAAAAKIHAALPHVTAFFAAGGTAPGVGAIQYNASGNMLQGSTNPTIYDQKTHKWVVDSSGIREALGFYLKLAQNGWQNPTLTEALSPNVVANAPGDLAKGNIAIAVGSNYYGTAWVKSVCGPCWAQGAKTMAVAKIPTINGQSSPGNGSPYSSLLGCWDLAIGAATKHAQAAWNFINVAQEESNMLSAAKGAGFVPPDDQYWSAPQYAGAAPPFTHYFATLLPYSKLAPELSQYSVWGTGYEQATGAIMSNPHTTVQAAVTTMKNYITGQLGASHVESLP
jgi:multiple sugar transport system substrate-binding protein